ncbi:MAG: hypothetical protein ACFFAO_00370 [Candidatus Hermodarchaeota archaeon]
MIEEFWIINESGICLFHRSINKETHEIEDRSGIQIEEQLFGGFLSGLMSFTEEMASEIIKKIELREGKFLIFTSKNLIFIVRSDLNVSDKKIKNKIAIIKELFIEKFSKELDAFNGEISTFTVFEKDLEEIFKKIVKSEKWGHGLLEL